jgi:TrmH family RNA methyltransferase
LRERGLRLLGSDPAASLAHDRADWTGGVALFLGSEGAGLPEELLRTMDQTIGIPLRHGVESLSVGAAAAVLLFAAAGQRAAS